MGILLFPNGADFRDTAPLILTSPEWMIGVLLKGVSISFIRAWNQVV